MSNVVVGVIISELFFCFLIPQTFIYLYFILIVTVTATFSLSNASFFYLHPKNYFSEVSEFVFLHHVFVV